MTTTAPDVLGELIAIAQERFDGLAFPGREYGERLVDLITDAHAYKLRVSALVEAARRLPKPGALHGNELAYVNTDDLNALHAALKEFGNV